MKGKARFWQPCRVCGGEHENPMSSSICTLCGARERWERDALEAKWDAEEVRRENLWNVPERAKDAYMAMEDDFTPAKVLEFMLAMHPERDE